MTLDDVLHELIPCLGTQDNCIIGWEQIRRWPKGAVDVFQKAGWLKKTTSAATVECHGCEENCIKPVHLPPVPEGQSATPFIACDVRSHMGRVKVPPVRLQQWQFTHTQLVRWISRTLNLRNKPEKDDSSASFKLGSIQGKQRLAELHLDLNNPVSLRTSGHKLPLTEITFILDHQPSIDRTAIIAMVDLPPALITKVKARSKQKILSLKADQNALEIGSPQWRTETARNAAKVRHARPGGSHDKQNQIREIWATGKYKSRDLCAEQECAGLGMAFKTARNALINIPKPKKSPRC